jgi:hypothetical protein
MLYRLQITGGCGWFVFFVVVVSSSLSIIVGHECHLERSKVFSLRRGSGIESTLRISRLSEKMGDLFVLTARNGTGADNSKYGESLGKQFVPSMVQDYHPCPTTILTVAGQ